MILDYGNLDSVFSMFCYGSGVMDVVRGSYPQKISVYNKASIWATDSPRMYRRMEPFIAGKAEEWIIKVT